MKRLHVHIKTSSLDESVDFYTAMFGRGPDKREDDYAKWLLDDPSAHISLSTHGGEPGIDHVGLALRERDELDAIAGRLEERGNTLFREEKTTCCYARSNKAWARDPQGAVWELFQTFGDSDSYGAEPGRDLAAAQDVTGAIKACCSATTDL